MQNLNESGTYGTVDFSDGEFLIDTARNFAASNQIPFILCGYSKFQVQNGLKLAHFESPKEKEYEKRVQVAGIPLSEIFNDTEDLNQWWQGESLFKKDEIPRLLFPLFAWDLKEEDIKKQVRDWDLLTKKEQSPIVTNHRLIPLLGLVDVHKFGYSSFEVEFCRMIREGKADRKHWQHIFEFLEYTSKTGLFIRKPNEELANELDITLSKLGVQFP